MKLKDRIPYLSSNDVLYDSRLAFFNAFEEYAPDANKKLYSLISLHIDSRDRETLARVVTPRLIDDFTKTYPTLSSGLDKFLREINMLDTEDRWFKKVCIYNLCNTYNHPESLRNTRFPRGLVGLGSGYTPFKRDEANFTFDSFAKWDPSKETKDAFEEGVRENFELHLHLYTYKIGSAAKLEQKKFAFKPQGLYSGSVPSSAIRLIQYQVLEMSYDQIVDLESTTKEEPISYQSVYDSTKRFANLIGIELRS